MKKLKIILVSTLIFLYSFSPVLAAINIVPNGGTGVGTITGIIQGNGTSPFSAITIGTGLNLTSGTLSATNAGTVTSVTGTANRITSSGGATPAIDISASYVGQSSITTLGTIATGVWHGTAIANANLANSTISGIALGNSLNTLTATNTSLTFSGAYDGSTARTIGLNLANSNTWTGQQIFNTTAPKFGTITGSTQCLHVDTTGLISGTGADCGSGSGGVNTVASADGSVTVTGTTAIDLAIVKAPKWSTARLLAGNSVDGSANVAFANKFIAQGTTDTGLSGAQFLGALGTGIVKNTTTTGVLSIAVAADFPTLNQNTTGSAASLTTPRTIGIATGDATSAGSTFDGTANNTNALTLATVNSNVGSFGSSTSIPSFTVNGKGLVTAASGNVVIAPAGTLSGTTLNSTVVTSSLTSVGTLGSLTVTGNLNNTALTASKVVFTDVSKNLTSTGIGTSAQFIKGDGSLDSSTYLTGNQSITLSGDITGSGTTAITTAYNGTVPFGKGGTGLTSALDDTTLVSSGAAWVASALPNCVDTAGNHLNYTTSTNAFSCGTSSSGGGSGTVTSVAMTVPSFLSISGSPITTSGTLAVSLSGTALPVANGGTGNTSVITAPTATTIVGQDASKNYSANNVIEGWATTATAAGTTTLSITSAQEQFFTGSTTQTVVLPTTSVVAGTIYVIRNQSTGAVTVQSSGANTITILAGNTWGVFTALVATPTTAANWDAQYSGIAITSGKSITSSVNVTATGADMTFTGAGTNTATFPTGNHTLASNDGSNLTISGQAIGDLAVASSTTAYGKLADVATGSVLISGGTSTAPSWSSTPTFTGTNISGTAASLSVGKSTNLIGGNNTTLLGDLPYQSNTDTTTLLTPNTTSTKKFLTMTGTGTNGAAPAWNTIATGDVPTLNQNTTGTANIAGGTLGAIVYQSAANTSTVLAATATANKLLVSGASAAPTWSVPTFPNASATTRKIIVSDGTNWTASTETYAVPGTSGNVLTSDGTNWTSAAPAGASVVKTQLPYSIFGAQQTTSGNTPATTLTAVATNTTATVGKVVVPFKMTVNHISIMTGAVTTTGTYIISLYSEDGATKLFSVTTASIVSGGTNDQVVITTSVSAVSVNAGNYYIMIQPVSTASSTFRYFFQNSTPSASTASFNDVAFNGVLQGTVTVTAGTAPTTITPTSIVAAKDSTIMTRLDN